MYLHYIFCIYQLIHYFKMYSITMSSLETKMRTCNCNFRCAGILVNVRKIHKDREEKDREIQRDLKVRINSQGCLSSFKHEFQEEG